MGFVLSYLQQNSITTSSILALYQLGTLFPFRGHHVLFGRGIVFNVENIGLATDLAIFHVSLSFPGGVIHRGLVPLAAARALEASVHNQALS
jgi:hypothetical protein